MALFAVLGTQAQLIALLLFVYLGLASAGGTSGAAVWIGVWKPARAHTMQNGDKS